MLTSCFFVVSSAVVVTAEVVAELLSFFPAQPVVATTVATKASATIDFFLITFLLSLYFM